VIGNRPSAVPSLLFLVGPTAAGKTALAIKLAKEFGAEIISCDSVQVYRELIIGSARPSKDELAEVRHHFVGHVSIADDYTAGTFEREALDLIRSNPDQSYIVCGGSGFYVQALMKGMYPIEKADAEIQSRIERRIDVEGLASVYKDLAAKDPEAAKSIAEQDRYRIVRALEIMESQGGEKLSDIKRRFEEASLFRFPGRKVGMLGLKIDRSFLEVRIEARTAQMLSLGLLDEVKGLVDRGLADRPALQSVGYRESLEFLKAPTSLSDLKASIVKGTMRLAKKQRTWFARDPSAFWVDAERELETASQFASKFFTANPID
jgi:tRNA dimethylallyltransferase